MSGAALMVCGTGSDVGKSRLVTGICRALARRGIQVAPFKGQNMALNSIVTPEGAEIGRAQGTQAQAAGVAPEAAMNPVLLKPTGERCSQVVVLGRPWKELDAMAYQRAKPQLTATVLGALADLRARFDVVVCEGAGSPAEVNLFDFDLVNLGLAVQAGIPAVLVGDIDRGGVFAHLYGTVALLPDDRRRAVRGFVVNKLRGDPALLGNATEVLRARCGIPTLGVVPYLPDLWLDAEDSLGLGWAPPPSVLPPSVLPPSVLDVAVLRLPHISNFTDVDPIAAEAGIVVRLVDHAGTFGDPDLVVVPGSKSTVADLGWMRARALDAAVERCLERGSTVVGICGGLQMLGTHIDDPLGVESPAPSTDGLGLLAVRTRFAPEKTTARRRGRDALRAEAVEGYEIHHGRHERLDAGAAWFELDDGPEGIADRDRGIYASALHGLFEADDLRRSFLSDVAARRGKVWRSAGVSFAALRERQIDRLADACEQHLDVERLLEIAGEAR